MIRTHLSYPNGVAYIASKRYYFGVGGGTSEFIQYMMNMKQKQQHDKDNAKGKETINNNNNCINDNNMEIENKQSSSVLSSPLLVPVWNIEILATYEDKASNIREILKISYQSYSSSSSSDNFSMRDDDSDCDSGSS